MPQNKQTQLDKYKIDLELAGKIYKGRGETMLEAINNLEQPANIKTTGLLKVSYKNLKTDRHLNILQIKRLFSKDFVKEIQAKRLSQFLR